MANLTFLEKRRLEELFGMESGYVLEFTDRTFSEFFRDVAQVDIFDSKYDYHSGSKANRLRAFWTEESDVAVAAVIEALIELAEYESEPDPQLLTFARRVVTRLGAAQSVNRDALQDPTTAVLEAPDGTPSPLKDSGEPYEVALSFAGEQRAYVSRVAVVLRDQGVEVFYDDFVDLWGQDLTVALETVFGSGSRYVVVFVSIDYVRKPWAVHERQVALADRIKRQDNSVLPVRFDDTEIPGLPSSIQYLAVRDWTPEQLAQRIILKLRTPGVPRG